MSIGFSRQEYWSGLLCPPSSDLPDSGTEPASLTSLALVGSTTSTTWEARRIGKYIFLKKNQVIMQHAYILVIKSYKGELF